MSRTDRSIRALTRFAAAGMVTVLALGACGGDDDDDDATASPSTTAAPDDGTDAAPAAFCQAYVDAVGAIGAAQDGGPDPAPQLDALREDAPDDVADAVDALVSELGELFTPTTDDTAAEGEDGGPPPIPSDEYFEADEAVGDYVADNCDLPVLEVRAREYEFEMPAEVAAGTTLVRFTNGGGEFHELVAMRINEGEERPLEELLALPEEQAATVATPAGFVFAPPGATAYTVIDFEAGRHAGICFIPVGTTPDALAEGEPEGAPHFTEGMAHEFEVTG
jgi:hypothetical protein